MRDHACLLHYKFLAAERPDLAEKIAEKHGVRFSVCDLNPNWFGDMSCPGEPMHNLFSGNTRLYVLKYIADDYNFF